MNAKNEHVFLYESFYTELLNFKSLVKGNDIILNILIQ